MQNVEMTTTPTNVFLILANAMSEHLHKIYLLFFALHGFQKRMEMHHTKTEVFSVFTRYNWATLLKMLKMPARLRDRPDPPDTVPRIDSVRVVDRDRPRTVDDEGEFVEPDDDVTPEWLPLMLESSCSSNGISPGMRKPDLNFSTVIRVSCQSHVFCI